MANGEESCLLPPHPPTPMFLQDQESSPLPPKPGGFLTEHDDIPLQEGTSENKADFIRVVGPDESRLAVLEAVRPVLKLIEVHRCARVCSDGERGRGSAPAGGAGLALFPDSQTYGWGQPPYKRRREQATFPLPSWRLAVPAPEALAALVTKSSMPVQGRLPGQGS